MRVKEKVTGSFGEIRWANWRQTGIGLSGDIDDEEVRRGGQGAEAFELVYVASVGRACGVTCFSYVLFSLFVSADQVTLPPSPMRPLHEFRGILSESCKFP